VKHTSLDRILYHQIHPLKLFTDVVTAFGAAVLLWRHQLGAALALGFPPSFAVSAALIRWADLEPYAPPHSVGMSAGS
jgi:hypothetical protein